MKVRKSISISLLVVASCAAAAIEIAAPNKIEAKESIDKDDIAAMNRQIQDVLATRSGSQTTGTMARATQAARAYVGTDSAPVDGLDGKPHAGPFVDLLPDTTAVKKVVGAASAAVKAVPTMLERLKEEISNIPEKVDGVMNDESRPAPRPGTTGTEGGVSEKEKAKSKQGPLVENTPHEPKAQPPLPHSEQERIRAQQEKNGIRSPEQDGSTSTTKAISGALSLEKPEDLPAKPHDLPHPDPKDGKDRGKGKLMETMPYTEGEKPKPKKGEAAASASASPGDEHEHSIEEWFHSFVVSLTMIIFTEIGDKTFLIAALMAMRHDRFVVFSAALSALIGMTVLSAVLGHLAPTLLPKRLTTLGAAVLFIIFGVRMLREGLSMSKSAGVGEEMKEVEAELEEKEHDLARNASRKDGSLHALESGSKDDDNMPTTTRGKKDAISGLSNLLGLVLSPAWVQTFIMTFLGEWGDRSQIATIAMAAGQDYWWVTLGAILGHACCTGLAVVGGRALAGRVSMRVVTIGGATAFLFFGVLYLVECYLEA